MNIHSDKPPSKKLPRNSSQEHSIILESPENLEIIQDSPWEDPQEKIIEREKPSSFLKTFSSFLFKLIALFFQFIFSKKETQPRFIKKRERKQILEQFKIHFYTVPLQKIEIAFPQYIYTIYHVLKKLEETLPEIIRSKLPLEKKFFLLEWINAILPEKARAEIESTDEIYFRKLITHSKEPEKMFHSFLKEWEKKTKQSNLEIVQTYNQYLESFYNLLRFDFVRLFKLFDPSFQETITPSFQPIFGKKGLEELMELNCYFQSIPFSSIPENIRMHLEETLKKVFGENASFSSSLQIFLLERIQELNKKKILDSMIQLISEDYNYRATPVSTRIPFLKHYFELMKKKKLFEYHHLAQKIKMEVINKNILQLFQDNMTQPEHYNEDLNELLQKHKIQPLRYIQATQLLQNFWVHFYLPFLGKQVHTLLVNGNFIQKNRLEQASEAYYQLEENMKQLDKLAGPIVQKGNNQPSLEPQTKDQLENEKRIQEIIRFIDSSQGSNTPNPLIERKIQEWEEEIFEILPKTLEKYQHLEMFLKDMIQDWENKANFKFLRNARTIKGNSNEEFFTNIIIMKEKLHILIQSIEILLDLQT